MAHERVPSGADAAYSAAVVAGDLCFVSGQLPFADGEIAGADIAEQTRLVLSNLFGVLEQSGFGPDELVSCTAILASLEDWPAFDQVFGEVMTSHGLPARMAFGAGEVPLQALVEIQAIAVRSR